MAGSRLEKIGTIFSRTQALIQSNAIRWEDRPLWYDLYEAFPPKEEPRYDRPIPNVKSKNIFYTEDKIRALLHNRNKQIGTFNLFNNKSKSLTKKFIETYQKLEKQQQSSDCIEEPLYEETIELLQREREKFTIQQQEEPEDQINLVKAFKKAKEKQGKPFVNISINVKDVLND